VSLAVVGLLLWAPLPLASNRPWSAALLALGLFLVAAWTAARTPAPLIPRDQGARMAGGAFLAALGWALAQAAPGLGAGLDHWADMAALTGRAPWGSLSLMPAATAEGALRLAAYATAAWLGATVMVEPAARSLLPRALAIGIALLALYALADLALGAYRIGWVKKWIYQDVATATFVNRNAWCVYAGLGAAAALVASRLWLWRALAAVCLLGALFSESRWGLVSVAAGLAALAVMRPGHPPWRALAAGAVALALAPLVLWATGHGRFLARLDPAHVLGDLRWDLYRVTLDAIAAAPWTGHGLGSYPVLYHHIRDETLADALVFQAHSVPLELMAELGIPAALALMAAYALMVARAARHARATGDPLARLGAAAGITAGLHGLLDFSLQTPALAVTVLVLLGAARPASAPAPRPAPAHGAPTPAPDP
jgi:O-antigen ligase